MATLTDKLKLRKPAGTDLVNVTTDISDNMDKIDDHPGIIVVADAASLPILADRWNGQVAIQEDINRILVWHAVDAEWKPLGWTDDAGRIGCSLRRVANQSIPDSANTNPSWDTEDYDPFGFITVPDTDVVIPAGLGGLYIINFMWDYGVNLPGTRTVQTLTTGLISFKDDTDEYPAVLTVFRPLAAGDALRGSVFQASGIARNGTGRLEVYRLGI